MSRAAAIGLRAKTGRAIAVVLSEPATSPEFVHREELTLADEAMPATMQPYHEVMELPWSESMVAVQPTIDAIQKIASAGMAKLIRDLQSRNFRVKGIAVVGSADRPLERLGNPHIRAHAAEGILFRRVLEIAAKANRCPCFGFGDELEKIAKAELKSDVKKTLGRLGKTAGPPWRSDEKSAAIAAWIALARG
jgi:hypothetical protein